MQTGDENFSLSWQKTGQEKQSLLVLCFDAYVSSSAKMLIVYWGGATVVTALHFASDFDK